MTRTAIDLQRLRLALRQMNRGNLLKIVERAVELVLGSEMHALVGDFVRLDEIAATESAAVPLLDEVRRFHAASLAGEYYEGFDVDSKNFMLLSKTKRTADQRFVDLLPFTFSEEYEECSTVRRLWTPRWTPVSMGCWRGLLPRPFVGYDRPDRSCPRRQEHCHGTVGVA